MDKQFTIKDIARRLNLSKSTVSRALRDCFDVSPETKKKVMELVKELDFQPSSVAINLRQQKTHTIGVIIPSFRIPFYSIAIGGIQEVASAAGFNVMVCQNEESYEGELNNVNSLVRSNVDGIIISFSKKTTDFDHIRKLSSKGLPVVLFNRVTDQLFLPKVSSNDYKSSYQATEYLIKRGCCKVAYISGPSNLNLTQSRKRGFTDCLSENNIPVRESLIMESDFSIESGERIAEVLLTLPVKPDAIFCVCDAVAFGVMMTLKKHRVRIPNDISVMGYTDEPVARLVDPSLTTISQPIFEIGRKASEILIHQINGKVISESELEVKLEASLVIRRSTI